MVQVIASGIALFLFVGVILALLFSKRMMDESLHNEFRFWMLIVFSILSLVALVSLIAGSVHADY